MHAQFISNGFSPFEAEYLQNWLHSNQKVQVKQSDNAEEGMPAIIQGLYGFQKSGTNLQ